MTMTRREVMQRTALWVGGALGGATAAGVLAGCRANRAPTWTPELLTPAQMATVSAMADHLLPKTSTPGARDVYADRFVDAILKGYFDKAGQDAFTSGLAAFDADCRQTHGKPFVDLDAVQRDAMFRKHERESPGLQPTVWGSQISDVVPTPTFYRQFKQLTLVGYYTSEEVGERILRYDPIPGRFDGCIPAGGNAWSL